MHFPECSFRGKQTILAWDGMWKNLISFAVLVTNRPVTRCGITSMQHQESVCFSNKSMFYRKRNFLFACSKLVVWTGFRQRTIHSFYL